MSVIHSETDTYDIIQILGKGTFGEVAKCWKRSTGHFVAIKILKSDSYRARIIKNELKMLRVLGTVNPDQYHFIRFFECFHDDTKSYLVFELLEQNIFEFQKENNFALLPARHIRTVTTQVLRALQKLKDLSIIHADLKPENIMIIDQKRFPFRVKVIDFGSASIFHEVRYVKEPYIQSRFYRSPEILLGLPFCEKVDMWSLGCVMAELHLGWPLYPGNSEYDQVRYIVETQGLPKDQLLNAATKAGQFFRRNPRQHAGPQWQLKCAADYQAETMVQPLERRKYVLKSLDQLETINITKTVFPDDEVIAEFHDRKNMVELIKRMLTLDSHERITPSAALKHPFVTIQQLKMTHEHTKYYDLSVQGLNAALNCDKRALAQRHYYNVVDETFYANSDHYECRQAHHIPSITSMQRAIDKMDNLTIEEPGREVGISMWPEGAGNAVYQPSTSKAVNPTCLPHSYHQGACFRSNHTGHRHRKEPVMCYYGNQGGLKQRKAPHHSKSDPTFGNVILLGQEPSTEVISWEEEDTEAIFSAPSSSAQEAKRAEEAMFHKEPSGPEIPQQIIELMEVTGVRHSKTVELLENQNENINIRRSQPSQQDSEHSDSFDNEWLNNGSETWSPDSTDSVSIEYEEIQTRSNSYQNYLHMENQH
ncbi:homeodomain-interacting protein kinase 4-like [Pristis pectinata]|uniref:homeodomain-interacting protein kinase 4-like n=1 Tax=Pristis pectinata TaxID=685728 RepID=UPI00223D15B2|nr:homeodomain-interacting protein kinase 4-like [Pristis pectinata]